MDRLVRIKSVERVLLGEECILLVLDLSDTSGLDEWLSGCISSDSLGVSQEVAILGEWSRCRGSGINPDVGVSLSPDVLDDTIISRLNDHIASGGDVDLVVKETSW